ncbi:MAG: acyltransferase [Pseudomonadota bacterium]
MKSSSGAYFIGLDHVRALAAYIVFTWHFIHVNNGHLTPPPAFPLSVLTEGHTGVALFMVLSGYLFAKLLDGKKIIYSQFLWNRFLRLAPLLFFVIFALGVQKYYAGNDIGQYLQQIAAGAIKPTLPNGGWSITVEFHFYLMLPLLLFLTEKWKYALLVIVLMALAFRTYLHQELGQVQTLSYLTIVGRIDQFVLGILTFRFRNKIRGNNALAGTAFIGFLVFYWYFDSMGGYYKNPSYPSKSMFWVYIPAIEGLAYALLIAWYDSSFKHSTGLVSRIASTIGTYSYSIYLLHFFVVFEVSNAIDTHLIELTNIHVAIVFSSLCFLIMIPIGYLSYRFIESPFLRFRTKYLVGQ